MRSFQRFSGNLLSRKITMKVSRISFRYKKNGQWEVSVLKTLFFWMCRKVYIYGNTPPLTRSEVYSTSNMCHINTLFLRVWNLVKKTPKMYISSTFADALRYCHYLSKKLLAAQASDGSARLAYWSGLFKPSTQPIPPNLFQTRSRCLENVPWVYSMFSWNKLLFLVQRFHFRRIPRNFRIQISSKFPPKGWDSLDFFHYQDRTPRSPFSKRWDPKWSLEYKSASRMLKVHRSFQMSLLKETCNEHSGFWFVFRWPFRVSSFSFLYLLKHQLKILACIRERAVPPEISRGKIQEVRIT